MPPARPAVRSVPRTWAPLSHPMFRALWIAQFVANIGTWAQLVGAQWLMGDLGGGDLAVALVQTAATLPVFLLVVPAGALGDTLDRRRLLLFGQALVLVTAGALAVLTAAGAMTPSLLLGFTAALGVGHALSAPTFQAVQPELVGPAEIPAAALLNGVNANVGQAVGPALGGLLIAVAGPAAAFALNAVSFLGVIAVLLAWRREAPERPLGAEGVLAAVLAGARYVRNAPEFGAVLLRSVLFILFAGALWALLPVVARGPLGLGAGGYGLLLAAVGVGAVFGAFVVPAVRRYTAGPGIIVGGGSILYAAATVVTGSVSSAVAATVALVLAGVAWIAVLSTLNAAAQLALPEWPRARALAYYQLAFMGGQALGGVLWGVVAEVWGTTVALTAAGAGIVALEPAARRWLALPSATPDVRALRHLPPPPEVSGVPTGRVLVVREWRVPAESAREFVEAMGPVGQARRRTGARFWGLFRDLEDPECYHEVFTVTDWTEHLRQHLERGTAMDRDAEEAARRLTVSGAVPPTRHLVLARTAKG